MSHIVQIKTQVRDPVALAAACRRLGLGEPTTGTAKLFSAEASGLIVQLPGWNYPLVVDTTTGETKFDNFNGYWGKQSELDKLLQAYAAGRPRSLIPFAPLKPAGGLSIEAEDYRSYWDKMWEKLPPDWLIGRNPLWPGNSPAPVGCGDQHPPPQDDDAPRRAASRDVRPTWIPRLACSSAATPPTPASFASTFRAV